MGLSNAERQRRHRERLKAGQPPPRVRYRRPKDKKRSKARRWTDAVQELLDLQAEYQAWLDGLPENLRVLGTGRAAGGHLRDGCRVPPGGGATSRLWRRLSSRPPTRDRAFHPLGYNGSAPAGSAGGYRDPRQNQGAFGRPVFLVKIPRSSGLPAGGSGPRPRWVANPSPGRTCPPLEASGSGRGSGIVTLPSRAPDPDRPGPARGAWPTSAAARHARAYRPAGFPRSTRSTDPEKVQHRASYGLFLAGSARKFRLPRSRRWRRINAPPKQTRWRV